jgi:hypothetical protein
MSSTPTAHFGCRAVRAVEATTKTVHFDLEEQRAA